MNTRTPLLNPLTLPNGAVLKNRLVMAPMTTCTGFYDGTVTSELVDSIFHTVQVLLVLSAAVLLAVIIRRIEVRRPEPAPSRCRSRRHRGCSQTRAAR